ncbi:MAG: shikimate kinase [Desulfosarcinaceae bacterium]|nr:shikimate kinase [Desulfosarcinaceae bacterium]
MSQRSNVILIGMPAVGKSTVGVLLAKQLGLGFMDTDLLIQTGEGRYLRDIIAAHGIDGFCAVEERYLRSVRATGYVIATGGSAIYSPAAMAHLATLGTIVYLQISLDQLEDRLANIDDRGVVHAPGESIADLYQRRIPLYERYAQVTVACDDLRPDRTVTAICAALP